MGVLDDLTLHSKHAIVAYIVYLPYLQSMYSLLDQVCVCVCGFDEVDTDVLHMWFTSTEFTRVAHG